MKNNKGKVIPDAVFRDKRSGSEMIEDSINLTVGQLIEIYAYAEAIVETVREPLLILQDDLIVRSANKSFFTLFQMQKSEVYGKQIFNLNGGEWNIPELKQLLTDILPNNSHFNDYEVRHEYKKIGKKIMLLNARRIILEGNKTKLILLAIEDVTAKREYERLKDDYLSFASHELKTPITTVKAYAQILEKRLSLGADDKNKHFVSRIIRQADKMNSLVADFLDLGKIEDDGIPLNKTRFDLNLLIKNISEDFQYGTDKHTITRKGSINMHVLADKNRLGQVVINLLTNAIKYSPDGGTIEIRMDSVNHKAIVSIKDGGIGISKNKQALIFDRFYRIKEGKDPKQGYGLGLYISSKIVKRHGGEIGVKSERGKGATFWFTLPINP